MKKLITITLGLAFLLSCADTRTTPNETKIKESSFITVNNQVQDLIDNIKDSANADKRIFFMQDETCFTASYAKGDSTYLLYIDSIKIKQQFKTATRSINFTTSINADSRQIIPDSFWDKFM